MPFSSSDPASSETRTPPSTPIHKSASLIGSQPPCPTTTSEIQTILGDHKTDVKQTRPGWSSCVSFCVPPVPRRDHKSILWCLGSFSVRIRLFCFHHDHDPRPAQQVGAAGSWTPGRHAQLDKNFPSCCNQYKLAINREFNLNSQNTSTQICHLVRPSISGYEMV